ncbi:hypothetical protein D3C71_1896990 [compost metagenome]
MIDADRTVLQSQREANQVAGLRAAATVSLVRSLGGGWGPLPESVAANGTTQPAAQQTAQQVMR